MPEQRAKMLKQNCGNPTIDQIADAIRKAEVTAHNRCVLENQEKVQGWIADEREACAKLAETYSSYPNDESWPHCETGAMESSVGCSIAAAIRAKGNS